MGPDEFAGDSYFIKQGKFAIKELKGEFEGDLPCDILEDYEDVIVDNDILNIVIFHPSRRDLMESVDLVNAQMGGFRVDQGRITMPCIGTIELGGLTLTQAQEKLTAAFRDEVKNVEVFVTYKMRLANKVEITGEVARTTIPVDGRMRLFEVLSYAVLSPHANLYSSYLVRDGIQLSIDFNKLVKEGDMSQNIVMRGGDKIYIGSAHDSVALVIGEVRIPRVIPLSLGYLPIKEALVSAGGIPFTGNKNCIQVIRGGVANPRIYLLSWTDITHLPNDNMLLMPGDVVYVSTTPITDWNQFLVQISPTIEMIALYDIIRHGRL